MLVTILIKYAINQHKYILISKQNIQTVRKQTSFNEYHSSLNLQLCSIIVLYICYMELCDLSQSSQPNLCRVHVALNQQKLNAWLSCVVLDMIFIKL